MNKKRKLHNKIQINHKKKLFLLYSILIILIIFIIIITAIFFIKVKKLGGGLSGAVSAAIGQTENEINNLDQLTILLLGSSQNLTDTIMILQYVPQSQKATLISIPRDTFTGNNKEQAKASDKINSIYQGKYPEKTLAAVNKITGLNIKYYALVDTEALKVLVDTIGGVYFDVPIDMNYTDKKQDLYIDLKAGYQLLDGNKAEQVVRFRHNQDGSSYSAEYGDNDYGRMKTQRNFLKAVLKQTISSQNITKISELIDIAQKYLKTNLPYDLIKKYIAPALSFNVDNIETGSIPGVSEKCNGIWIYIANKSKTKEYLNNLNKYLYDLENISDINVEILNGSGDTKNSKKIKKILENEGFVVTNVTDIDLIEKTTIINKVNNSKGINKYLENLLSLYDISYFSNIEENSQKILIILGKDFID